MTAILIDQFPGDPDDYYRILHAVIEQAGIPDVEYGTAREMRGARIFKGPDETATTFVVQDPVQLARILAYRFGNNFYVSIRSEYTNGASKRIEKGYWRYLDEVQSNCFDEVIKRAIKRALALYMEAEQVEVPKSLNPEDVFIVAPGE